MVLRGFKREKASAVGEDDETDFFASEKFLDDEGSAGHQELGDGRFGFGGRMGDDDAFAGGKTVGF